MDLPNAVARLSVPSRLATSGHFSTPPSSARPRPFITIFDRLHSFNAITCCCVGQVKKGGGTFKRPGPAVAAAQHEANQLQLRFSTAAAPPCLEVTTTRPRSASLWISLYKGWCSLLFLLVSYSPITVSQYCPLDWIVCPNTPKTNVCNPRIRLIERYSWVQVQDVQEA